MNDHKDAIQEERNAHVVARQGWHDRLRRDIERLADAYGGDYSEVITAYRHQAKAAKRRLKRLESKVMQARQDVFVANYELRLATAIIDELSRKAVIEKTTPTIEEREHEENREDRRHRQTS
jgi:hypothetical protein